MLGQSDQIWQLSVGEAAAAAWPQVQPAAKLTMFSWSTHTEKAHLYSTNIYMYTWPTAQITQTAVAQTQTAPAASFCSPLWLRMMEVHWWDIHVYAYMQGGCFQQLSSYTPSAQQMSLNPNLPCCWHLDMWAPKAAAPVRLLIQTISYTHKCTCRTVSPLETPIPHCVSGSWPGLLWPLQQSATHVVVHIKTWDWPHSLHSRTLNSLPPVSPVAFMQDCSWVPVELWHSGLVYTYTHRENRVLHPEKVRKQISRKMEQRLHWSDAGHSQPY